MDSKILTLPSGREITLKVEYFREKGKDGVWSPSENEAVTVKTEQWNNQTKSTQTVWLPKMDGKDLVALGEALIEIGPKLKVKQKSK